MPSPTKGVPVELDKVRHLRYPIASVKTMSDEDADLVSMLYLGLKHEDPDLTAEQVGDMVALEDLPALIEPIRKATAGLVDLESLFNLNGSPPEGGAEGNAPE